MTHNIIKSIAALAFGAMLLTGCGKENNENIDNKDIETLGVTNVHTTGCLQSKVQEDEESWHVYWAQGELLVHHTGWMVPCDWHNVTVSIELDGSVVTINECGEGGEVDCICDKHNGFTITGLAHGTYTFIFKECGEERHRQEYTI
ncbi:MAG: hypothetical protein J6X88_01915 [Bacteroidales bacterium]|nr:hypothetical protein [Bacteroidales bacterium]